ncbi:hypothetical protein V1477_005014 [Vespula maculifrons]|uniref:Uncharacterized protein n=1 Tax=Vespula maculifrons TaxID=7453 RepID=A0ABD2CPB6_VESMC
MRVEFGSKGRVPAIFRTEQRYPFINPLAGNPMFSSCSSEWVVARGASGSQLAILRNDDLYVGSSELNRGDMVEEKRMNGLLRISINR